MKIYSFIICIVGILTQIVFAQKKITASKQSEDKGRKIKYLPNFNRSLLLDEKTDTTANINFW